MNIALLKETDLGYDFAKSELQCIQCAGTIVVRYRSEYGCPSLFIFIHVNSFYIVDFNSIFYSLIHCTVRQCSPLRRKFMECSIISLVPPLLLKHLVIGQCQKASNFSDFHWSPHGSLVSIGQHFVTTRVVHLPKRTETSLITESDQSGLNHQLLQLCTTRIAWSESMRTVHRCNS